MANPAVKTKAIAVRNMTYINSDDARYHEAISDLKHHIELLNFTVEQQNAALEELRSRFK